MPGGTDETTMKLILDSWRLGQESKRRALQYNRRDNFNCDICMYLSMYVRFYIVCMSVWMYEYLHVWIYVVMCIYIIYTYLCKCVLYACMYVWIG
jgi:hypothetical protein